MITEAWGLMFAGFWAFMVFIGLWTKDGALIILSGLISLVFAFFILKELGAVPTSFHDYFQFLLAIVGVLLIIIGAFQFKENLA